MKILGTYTPALLKYLPLFQESNDDTESLDSFDFDDDDVEEGF